MMLVRKSLAALAIALLLLPGAGRAGQQEREEPGVFARGDVVIGGGDVVGKLLVVDGKAIVDGQVLRWAAVVRGDLVIRAGGRVGGAIIVLDGQATAEPGATSPAYKIVLPPGSPAIKTLAGALLACTLVLVALAGLAGRLAVRRLKAGRLCRQLCRRLVRDAGPGLFILWGLLISAALMAAFVHLAAETFLHRETDFIDQVVIWLVRHFANPALDKAMLVVTELGSGHAYLLLAPLVIAGLFLSRRRHEAFSLAICLTGAALLNFLLKHLFERARPDLFRVISETGYSFPSGHAMVSLCFYGMLAYIAGRGLAWRKRAALYGLTAVLLAAVGLSRIYLGVHYPSDVLAGYIAGGTWLAFTVTLLWWWEQK